MVFLSSAIIPDDFTFLAVPKGVIMPQAQGKQGFRRISEFFYRSKMCKTGGF
jgi:hypothetical protein